MATDLNKIPGNSLTEPPRRFRIGDTSDYNLPRIRESRFEVHLMPATSRKTYWRSGRTVLGLLALINLAWMIHAVRSWRTSRQAVDAEQPASIPEGATEPFMKQPLPSPDRVRPEETESH